MLGASNQGAEGVLAVMAILLRHIPSDRAE
jgi:hypothetical protein